MADKIVTTQCFDEEDAHKQIGRQVIDLVAELARRQALNSLAPEDLAQEGNIRWHCMLCGHSWEGWIRVNPEQPDNCAKCKRPDWNRLPKELKSLHDPDCPDCQNIIRWKLKEYERAQGLLEQSKKVSS